MTCLQAQSEFLKFVVECFLHKHTQSSGDSMKALPGQITASSPETASPVVLPTVEGNARMAKDLDWQNGCGGSGSDDESGETDFEDDEGEHDQNDDSEDSAAVEEQEASKTDHEMLHEGRDF